MRVLGFKGMMEEGSMCQLANVPMGGLKRGSYNCKAKGWRIHADRIRQPVNIKDRRSFSYLSFLANNSFLMALAFASVKS
jgi:hypothetical protein